MIRSLRSAALLAMTLVLGWGSVARAQSTPGFVTGQVPTASQWNSYFAAKLDYSAVHNCATNTVYANVTVGPADLICTPNANVLGVGSAQKWVTARSLTFNGDVGGIATFDGSANVVVGMALATVNVGPGLCGDSTHVCQITTDGKGRALSQAQIAIGGGTVTTTGSPSTGQMTKFSGATSITTAVSGTDYAPATSGTSILAGNGSGAFVNTTLSGLSYNSGTHVLAVTGSAGAIFAQAAITTTNFGGL